MNTWNSFSVKALLMEPYLDSLYFLKLHLHALVITVLSFASFFCGISLEASSNNL